MGWKTPPVVRMCCNKIIQNYGFRPQMSRLLDTSKQEQGTVIRVCCAEAMVMIVQVKVFSFLMFLLKLVIHH